MLPALDVVRMFWEDAKTPGPATGKKFVLTFVSDRGRMVERVIDEARANIFFTDPETGASGGVSFRLNKQPVITVPFAMPVKLEEL